MATNNNLLRGGKAIVMLLITSIFLFSNCYSFKKGVNKYRGGDFHTADKIFIRNFNHRTWDLGARTYHERIKLFTTRELWGWQQSDSILCGVLDSLTKMPFCRKKQKLNKYDVNTMRVDAILVNIQHSAIEHVRVSGLISDLDTLLDHFPCWHHIDSLKNIANEIVNSTICCSPETEPSYRDCTPSNPYRISYDNATRIIKRHTSRVKTENLEQFWSIKKGIWQIFRNQTPAYCGMDQFRNDHPEHPYLTDCWYDYAWHALCSDSLKAALAFHAEYPHSVFDEDICKQVMCLGLPPKAIIGLKSAEIERLTDIRLMFSLKADMCGGSIADTARFFQDLENLSRKYYSHAMMFDIAQMSINYFMQHNQPKVAAQLLKTIAPFFLDQNVCPNNPFEFQVGKQAWFQQYLQILDKPVTSPNIRPKSISAWNTKQHDEFSSVSWDIGQEAYFVRRDGFIGTNQIMYSKSDGLNWSAPVPVRELNFSHDVVPLSITDDGLWLLLRSGGKIFQSSRRKTSMPWSKPEPLYIALPIVTWAALSADGFHVLVEGISDVNKPRKDIFLCKLSETGRLGKPEKLKTPINLALYNETHPYITAGGRLLYLTSDRPGGMGGTDMYVVSLPEVLQFANLDSSIAHLDWRFNTSGDDYGFSFISDYTGKGFFHRPNLCGNNMDIFEVEMLPIVTIGIDSVKSRNPILRFAGIVLDENGKPIPGDEGSFVEFITDYDLHATKKVISKYGTYIYTAPSNAKAVRLFPEIPGYYSERDTTHFPAMLSDDQIIRDTFKLKSFEYIRKNFVLEYGTFFNKTAEFDDKDRVYPELVRLAKIARRMGAELVLKGHTDNTGTEAENQALSEHRAEAVRSFLVNKCGFDRNKITIIGFGATKPKCPNTTEEGKRCNRRIEIVFKMPEIPIVKTPMNKTSVQSNPSPAAKN